MLNPEIAKLLNEQITKEFFSAYLYLDIANFYSDHNLNGFENWFYIQMQEERDHALLFRQYLLNNDEQVKLLPIEAPRKEFVTLKDPLVETLAHEISVTEAINKIYEATYTHNDYRTRQFLDWFIKEQGEEEKNSNDLIKRFELFGDDAKSLYMLDNELGARVYAAPSLVL